jgi:hypothetical protein
VQRVLHARTQPAMRNARARAIRPAIVVPYSMYVLKHSVGTSSAGKPISLRM